jgi:hypothetical protein
MEMSQECPTYEGGPRVLAQHFWYKCAKNFSFHVFWVRKYKQISIEEEEGNFCSLLKNPKPNGPKLEKNFKIIIIIIIIIIIYFILFLKITNFKEEEETNK